VNEADDWLGYLAFLLAGAGRDLEGGAELEVPGDPAGAAALGHILLQRADPRTGGRAGCPPG
jgi:hypothetical protein